MKSGKSTPGAGLSIGAICLAILVGVAALLQFVGRHERTFGEIKLISDPTLTLNRAHSSRALFDGWTSRGRRGRTVVYFSRFLHFVDPEGLFSGHRLDTFPFDLLQDHPSRVSHLDHLWMAARVHVARDVVHIVPTTILEEKLNFMGLEGRSSEISVTERGFHRRVLDHVPELGEPPLIGIDASLFQDPEEAGRLLGLLMASGWSTDDLTLCAAHDNPEVSDAAREALDRWFRQRSRKQGEGL